MPNTNTLYLDLDKTGQSTNNRIELEYHTLPNTLNKLIIPKYGSFFSESIQVYWVNELGQNVLLQKDVDYHPTEMLEKVTAALGKEVSAVILLIEPGNKQNFVITYQALGGSQQINRDNLFNVLYQIENPSAQIDYKDIKNKPKGFQPGPHLHDSLDLYGLEYIRDAISKLDTAIMTSDLAINQSLITYAQNTPINFLTTDINKVPQAADTAMALVKSTEDTLKLVHNNILKIGQRMEKLLTDKETFDAAVMDYRADNYNDILANVANLLCRKRFLAEGLVVNIPTQIEGIAVYLVSDNYNPITRTWIDQTNNNIWTANVASAPAYGACSTNPAINSVKFTDGKFLTKGIGTPLTLTKDRTIITVSAPLTGTDYIKLDLFSDTSAKLSIDTSESTAYQYKNTNSNEVYYDGKISSSIGNKAVVSVCSIGTREEDCRVLSGSPYKKGIAPNGVIVDNLDLESVDSGITTIGTVVEHQSAEILMILMYDRVLSKTEIHSILTYIRLKYRVDVTFIENGDFGMWDEGYGSDLNNTIDFVNRGCAGVTDRKISLWDTDNIYTQPGIANPTNIKIDYHPYLLVLSNDATKAFWRQTVELDTYCRYEFTFSMVYGQVNLPLIRMRINGLGISTTVALNPNESILRDYVISFTPTKKTNKIELFNLNESTTGNCFGIGAIKLVRKIYAD